MELNYIVKNNKYKNINEILISEFHLSNRLRTKLINLKRIYKNNLLIDTRSNLNINDIISINFDYEEDNSNIIPTKMDLNIIYEDDWILVLNKPAGIAIHPSMLHFDDSLSNGVKYYYDLIRLAQKNKTCQ